MINSHSLNPNKFKTLKDFEKEHSYKKTTFNINNNNSDTNDVIQNLMNNIKHLEITFNKRPNRDNDNI